MKKQQFGGSFKDATNGFKKTMFVVSNLLLGVNEKNCRILF